MPARAEAAIGIRVQSVVIDQPILVPFDEMTDHQQAKVGRARDAGIINPIWAMQAAIWSGVPYYVLCAYLEQESAKGENLWGSDKTWMRGVELREVGIFLVTADLYFAYRLHRDRDGFGNQGVGPMQLTHPTFQDRGDQLGGTHLPLPNILAAVESLAIWKTSMTWHQVAARYNGSESYADHNDELRAKWKPIIVG